MKSTGAPVDTVPAACHNAALLPTKQPLHLAGACGELAICKELVLHGANPDLVDGGGWNALHHGAFGGHLPVVKFLLREQGVEKDILDKKLCTAQHWAKFMGHGHVEAYLDAYVATMT